MSDIVERLRAIAASLYALAGAVCLAGIAISVALAKHRGASPAHHRSAGE